MVERGAAAGKQDAQGARVRPAARASAPRGRWTPSVLHRIHPRRSVRPHWHPPTVVMPGMLPLTRTAGPVIRIVTWTAELDRCGTCRSMGRRYQMARPARCQPTPIRSGLTAKSIEVGKRPKYSVWIGDAPGLSVPIPSTRSGSSSNTSILSRKPRRVGGRKRGVITDDNSKPNVMFATLPQTVNRSSRLRE